MEIQEVLKNYNVYKFRIGIAEKEIQQLKNEMYDIKSAKLDGMPKASGYTTSNLEETIIRTQEKMEEKQKYIDDLKNQLGIVDDLINILKKNNQEIIIMRYCQRMSIKEISVEKDRTYNAIQKTIDASIEYMQKEYEENNKN